jgi:hypothetical protein
LISDIRLAHHHTGSRVPLTIECFRCHKTGLVRLETVVRAGHAVKHYHCGRCDYAWNDDSQPADADRRKRVTQRRMAPRNKRRKADA